MFFIEIVIKSLHFKPKFNFLYIRFQTSALLLRVGCIVLLCVLPAALKLEKHQTLIFILHFIIQNTLSSFSQQLALKQQFMSCPTMTAQPSSPHFIFLERRNQLSTKDFLAICSCLFLSYSEYTKNLCLFSYIKHKRKSCKAHSRIPGTEQSRGQFHLNLERW